MGRQHKTLTNLNQHKSTDNTLSKLTGPDGSSGPSPQIAVTDLLLVGSWLSDGDFNYSIWRSERQLQLDLLLIVQIPYQQTLWMP